MARSRNIKPGFFKNEDLAECSPWARLCFAGLWTLADREGRLENRAKRIKGELFPFDSVEVEPLLDELERYGFITRYAVAGRNLVQVVEFQKHQNPHYRELPSDLPAPESPGLSPESTSPKPEALKEKSDLQRGSSPADSGFLIPDSGEREGDSAQRAKPPALPFDGKNAEKLNGKAIVELADGFELPERWGLDAEALGWKPREVLLEAERFRQHWTQGKGQGTRRSVKGWRSSWSRWLAIAAEKRR